MAHPPAEDVPEPEFGSDEPLSGGPGGAATSDSRELPAFREALDPPAVYVVEPDPLYRRMFTRIVAATGYDVKSFSSPAEFLSEVGPENAGCLLFAAEGAAVRPKSAAGRPEEFAVVAIRSRADRDITPAELLARLAASRSPLAAVAVTASLPFDPALALLGRGAVDVLEKPVKRDDLIAAVREAIGISAARRDRREAGLRLTRLSDRQYRLLGLLASRWPRWMIALRLGIRLSGVRERSDEIVRVLGAASVAEAAEIYKDPDFAPRS